MSFAVKFSGESPVDFHRDKPPVTFLDDVIWFQADGDELETIRAQFVNVPITNGNYCRWTGELANFIFDNLRLRG